MTDGLTEGLRIMNGLAKTIEILVPSVTIILLIIAVGISIAEVISKKAQ